MDLLGYIRVTSDEQAQSGHSLSLIQPKQIEKWCELHGHNLIDIIIDKDVIKSGKNKGKARGVSAGKAFAKRAGGKLTLDRLRAGEAQGLVITKVDRVFRDGKDTLNTGFDLRKQGTHLFTTEEYTDIHSRDGWLMFGIKGLLAENERGRTCDRNKDVSLGLRDDALAYGPVPFGCVRDDEIVSANEIIKRLFRDPNTWLVREYIVSRYNALRNYRALARELQHDSITAPQGGVLWHVNTLKNIIDTHDALKHYPLFEETPETVVS